MAKRRIPRDRAALEALPRTRAEGIKIGSRQTTKRGTPVFIVCEHCGGTKRVRAPSKMSQRFCSIRCKQLANPTLPKNDRLKVDGQFQCSVCGCLKSQEEFSPRIGRKSGRYSRCRECVRTIQRAKDSGDRDTARRSCRDWHEREKQRVSETGNSGRSRVCPRCGGDKGAPPPSGGRSYCRPCAAAWRRIHINRETERVAWNARNRRVRQATPPWVDLDAIKAIYEECARLTRETGIVHHVDHQLPIAGKTVSGLHVHQNLQILMAEVNLAKSNKYAAD
jgi:hypothetical protein